MGAIQVHITQLVAIAVGEIQVHITQLVASSGSNSGSYHGYSSGRNSGSYHSTSS